MNIFEELLKEKTESLTREIIDKYDWKLTEIVSGLYNDRYQELCFNGKLTKDNDETIEQKLYKKLIRTLKNRYEKI